MAEAGLSGLGGVGVLVGLVAEAGVAVGLFVGVVVGDSEGDAVGVLVEGDSVVVTSIAGPRSWSVLWPMTLATAVPPPMATMLSAPVMTQAVWRLMIRSCSS